MKTLFIVVAIILVFYWIYAYANRSKTVSNLPAVHDEFELHIGESVMVVRLDEPFTVTTPAGEKLEMVLRRKAVLRYEGPEVVFDYPSELQLSREVTNGVATLTLEGSASPFIMVQIYPAPNTPEGVLHTLIEAFKNEYQQRQATFLSDNNREVVRHIGGVSHQGRALKFRLGGQAYVTELYSFVKNGAVVALILQHDVAEAELAERYFQIVTGSLN